MTQPSPNPRNVQLKNQKNLLPNPRDVIAQILGVNRSRITLELLQLRTKPA
jgi:hypothetical protein